MKNNWIARLGQLSGCILIALSTLGSAHAAQHAYMTASGEPWGDFGNHDAMSAAFGSDWDRLQYGASFNDYALLYIDGGSETAVEMVDFLNTNRSLLEDYTRGGGRLFINAATEYQTTFDLVFGATSAEQPFETRGSFASALDPSSTLFAGAGRAWEGYSFSHDALSTPDTFSALIRDEFGQTVLAGGFFGEGYVMLGTQTNTMFHVGVDGSDPFQLRVNELLYARAVQPPPVVSTPVPEAEAAAMLLMGLAGVGWMVRRRKAG